MNAFVVGFLIVLALVAASIVVGTFFARRLRMIDYGWKFSLILAVTLLSSFFVYTGWPPKLGVDLGGGALLVYQVDLEKLQGSLDSSRMDALVSSISKRVNPGGQKEITVRPLGSDKIQITMPAVSGSDAKEKQAESDQIKRTISRSGSMEFRILATDIDDRYRSLMATALADPKNNLVKDSKGNTLAKWVPVRDKEVPVMRNMAHIATRMKGDRLEALVLTGVNDPYDVKGDDLKDARSDMDSNSGEPCVRFTFNTNGAALFGKLTGDHLPLPNGDKYQLGIVLDDELQSAPSINSMISDSGIITGRFTPKEVDELVRILNAGALPAALIKEPVRDMNTGPTLGGDTIQKSTNAMIISAIAVPLFMLMYYRFAGLVAVVALALNMLILVAIMILVKAPFTLPALAGLALTVGMDVDNNVLIYERLREELAHGAALRMAIRNAFHRAGVVIVDANITHLIAATVLYAVGTEQIKGFAITFWLGAVLSIWATMFVARVIFEVAERQQWITKIKMMHVIGHTSIDFMAWFPAAATFSVIITVLGLGVAYYRGVGLFDIDFTGGVSVQALFNGKQDISQIRKDVDKLPDVAVSNVQLKDEPEGQRFVIDTSWAGRAKEGDKNSTKEVKAELKRIFGDKLVSNEMTLGTVSTIPSAPPPTAPEAKPAQKPAEKPTPDKKQSRNDLPPDNVVAMGGSSPFLVAQAEKPATTEAKPAEAKKPEAKAPETKAPETKPAEAQAPETKPAAAEIKPATTVPFVPSRFAGGTQADLKFKYKVDHSTLEEKVTDVLQAKGLDPKEVEFKLSNPNFVEHDTTGFTDWTLEIKLPKEKAEPVLTALAQQIKAMPYFPDVDSIGGAVASDTRYYAVIALVSSWVLIIMYLWIRFQGVAFGLAAVIALIHDVLVMLGAIAFSIYLAKIPGMTALTLIEPFKINLPIVAAFLTIIGYSVNDTIVVFDRIREVRGKDPRMTRQMVNDSTNQTLSRTLLTSFTVLLVVCILYTFGGQAVHGFAFALIIGVMTGTYSSIYVAAPILLWLVGKHKEKA